MRADGLRPGRINWVALLGLLWAITLGALRDFVWEDLREGLIRLDGLNRVVRFLIVLGFGLLLAGVGLLLTTDVWRVRAALLPASIDIPGRGNLIPTVLLPITLFLMAIAWSYLLAGALRVHSFLGGLVYFLYATTAVSALVAAGDPSSRFLWLGWAALIVVTLFFVLPATRRMPADAAFLIMLVLVSVQYGLVQTQILLQDRISGIGLGQINLESSIQSLQSLALPFLLLLGMDIARFTQQASTWTVLVVRRRLPDALSYVALAGVLGWLLMVQTGELLGLAAARGWRAALAAYAGGLGIPLGVGLVWLAVEWGARRGQARLAPHEVGEAAEQAVVWVILLRLATVLIAFGLFQLQAAVGTLTFLISGPLQNAGLILMAVLTLLADWLTRIYDAWLWLAGIMTLGAGLVLARPRPVWNGAALYLAAYGVMELWLLLTKRTGPLAALTWQDQPPVHGWFVLLVTLTALLWAVRRTLTPARAGWLLFLLLILWLLRQTDFIENPFSPLFGFAGVGFIAFGIVWDALTAGSWANVESPRLPRAGRIFLYLGYVLLTVTLISWALATHNLDVIGRFTGDAALLGLNAVGKPLLYLFFPLVLALPAEQEPA